MKFTFSLLSLCLGVAATAQTVDSSFGVNGYLPCTITAGVINSNQGAANALAVQPDGKILAAISWNDPNGTDLFYHTYRYKANGTPDSSFGVDHNGDSKLFMGSNSENHDIVVLPDGKILTIGSSEYCINGVCGSRNFVFMRLKPNGERDSTFADNGLMRTDQVFGTIGHYSFPVKVRVAPTGKYIIAGQGTNNIPFVGQVTTQGLMDASFGTNGRSSVMGSNYIRDMALDNAGNIYLLMQVFNTGTANTFDNKVVKLLPNGSLDNTFGTNGAVIVNQSNLDRPTALALRSDGKIVFVGTGCTSNAFAAYGDSSIGYMYILNTNGSISNLTPAGGLTFHIPGDTASFVNAVTVLPGDKMLVGGNATTMIAGNFHQKAFMTRFNANGTYDGSFNNTGTIVLDYGLHSNIGALCTYYSILGLSNGDILAGGMRNPIVHNVRQSVFLVKFKASPTSGIAQGVQSALQGNVYPNPWSSLLNLGYELEQDDKVSIALYDMMGRNVYVYEQQAQRSKGQHTESLQRPQSLAAGQYVLTIATASGKAAQYKVQVTE